MTNGTEWIVEARGCKADALRDLALLQQLFANIIADLNLRPVGNAQWHQFPAPGGITGMLMLAESHLTVHTFPEHNSFCLNLFCCKPREEWAFSRNLRETFGAEDVDVRKLDRIYNSEELAGVLSVSIGSAKAGRR